MDFLLTNGDVSFTEGDIVSTSGINQIAQNIANRLRTFRREWFLDKDFGPDYIQDVFKKNPSLTLIRAVLVAQIELAIKDATLSGVNAVLKNFELTLESATRILQVAFTIRDEVTQLEAEQRVVIG